MSPYPIILISLWSKAWPRQLGTPCFVLTHAVDLISTRKTPSMPSTPSWLRTREACLTAVERLCSQVAADGVKISERNSGGASS